MSRNQHQTAPRNTANDLTAKIARHINDLAEAVSLEATQASVQLWLNTLAKFHSYSINNLFLIAFQMPDASHVAGYNRWKELNRQVKKGEHGIAILAPLVYKKADEPESKEIHGFKVVYVFDISQTEGDPLPETPTWSSTERQSELHAALIEFANSRHIQVSEKPSAEMNGAQGISQGGAIAIDPQAGTKTLIHEIAHELMHRNADRPHDRDTRELEAESVAYVLAAHFGLETKTSSTYLALWQIEPEAIKARLNRISHTAKEIITAIEGVTEPCHLN